MNTYLIIGLVATALTQSYQSYVAYRTHKAIRRFEANFIPISFDVIMSDNEDDAPEQESVN